MTVITGSLPTFGPMTSVVPLRTAHAIEAGRVQVNQGLGQSPGHSYGGYKESGIGREFSLEGMLESYTQRKNVTVNLTH
jgi:acyl-CoA reductase-like NAD-dependent aldehyde dehydrogenase